MTLSNNNNGGSALVLMMCTIIMMTLTISTNVNGQEAAVSGATAANNTSTGNATAATTTGGMSSSDGKSSNDRSILENIAAFDKLSMLKLALQRSEFSDITAKLNDKNLTQKLTLFAPTNEAVLAVAQAANTSSANETFSVPNSHSLTSTWLASTSSVTG
jgi:uncharacterized surface protein with fasciclin (FAS1) repeats